MQKAVSKLYHIPFWLVYHYLWWVVAMGNPMKAAESILFSPYAVKFAFYVVLQAVAVYFNLYYLIPRYLQKGRFGTYIGYLGISLVVTALAIVAGYYVSAWLAHQSVEVMFGRDKNCFFSFFGEAMPSTLASTTLAMSIKLTKNWISTERRKQLLEKEKLETELRFLKYQFNPHFLFNSINSIFFLIHKNPDAASESLAKFSDLLRHHLYECNDEFLPLEKEIAYLRNFIALEKLRQNRTVQVTTLLPETLPGDVRIAPFILMTFIENAFKHVAKDSGQSLIAISLQVNSGMLEFEVANSVPLIPNQQTVHYGGIGLKNVQRRLELIYPDRHQLEIREEDGIFLVRLSIALEGIAITHSAHLITQ